MAPALEVVVTRGRVIEARHRVHAVVLQDGRQLLAAGETSLVTFLRSAAKPIQALPLVRARPDLRDDEIAIACASHLARPEQIAAVLSLLASAPADESDLETGPEPTPLEHNCSGKHAGFLALCRARGWPSDGYRLAGHPCQREMLGEVAAAADVEVGGDRDGGRRLRCRHLRFPARAHGARVFAAREDRRRGRTLAAMQAHPNLIRGPLAADSICMRELPGWTAKGGAEGLMCVAGPDGLGLALKIEDGETRAVAAALAEVVRRLGLPGRCGARARLLSRTAVARRRGDPARRLRSPVLEAPHTNVGSEGNACDQEEKSSFRTCSQMANRVIRFGADGQSRCGQLRLVASAGRP